MENVSDHLLMKLTDPVGCLILELFITYIGIRTVRMIRSLVSINIYWKSERSNIVHYSCLSQSISSTFKVFCFYDVSM